MSDLIKSDVRTAQDNIAGELPVGSLTSGELSVATVKVVHTGSMAAGDRINLFELPSGAVFEPFLSSVVSEDQGGNVEYTLEDGAGNDYLTNLNFDTAQAGLLGNVSGSTAVEATLLASEGVSGEDTSLYLSASVATTPTDGAESTWKLVYRTK